MSHVMKRPPTPTDESWPPMTTIGIIGSGNIGGTVARLAVAAGHHVVLSNSRGRTTWTTTGSTGRNLGEPPSADLDNSKIIDRVKLEQPEDWRRPSPVRTFPYSVDM
jgi:glutamate dehydrogenase/leucine dehydrogenase